MRVVPLGHIAMPSMIHASFVEGHSSAGSVGSVVERSGWWIVWVTVTTAVLASCAVVAASLCGSAEASVRAHASRLSMVWWMHITEIEWFDKLRVGRMVEDRARW
jgi:hypothetical protein